MGNTEDSGCLAQRQKLLEGGEDLSKLHRDEGIPEEAG